MSEYTSEKHQNQNRIYHLYAVSNQRGSLSSGHYTSYVQRYGRWYFCNDLQVTPASKADILSNENYILFYYRQDIKDRFGL